MKSIVGAVSSPADDPPESPGLLVMRLESIGLCLAAILAATPSASAQDALAGQWVPDDSRGTVRIERCGARLCGYVSSTGVDRWPDGQALTDRKNPDSARRTRPICGLQVIGSLAAGENGVWDGGWIYDPKTGKTYDLQLSLAADGKLAVHGYLGVKMMGKTLHWSRATKSVAPCKPPV